jgi:phosphoribosylamine--glycine ligase
LLLAALDGTLAGREVNWFDGTAVDVVLAADGYPESPRKGDVISGVEAAAGEVGILVFHAGTALDGADLVSAGGRVINVVGTAATAEKARARAYSAASKITWKGVQYRTDIGL